MQVGRSAPGLGTARNGSSFKRGKTAVRNQTLMNTASRLLNLHTGGVKQMCIHGCTNLSLMNRARGNTVSTSMASASIVYPLNIGLLSAEAALNAGDACSWDTLLDRAHHGVFGLRGRLLNQRVQHSLRLLLEPKKHPYHPTQGARLCARPTVPTSRGQGGSQRLKLLPWQHTQEIRARVQSWRSVWSRRPEPSSASATP